MLGEMLVTQSCPTLETLWTVACQAPLPMGFSPGKNTGGRWGGVRDRGAHVYL